ncbi:MAG: histidine phosphatase family protein [Chloroflexota bacterium]|nr:histidine phosphatase family protein [Chloroflexota bacterium]
MRVYLIRHAQSENNILGEENIHRRKVDPALTEMGYRQRDILADFLARTDKKDERFEISHLYTSAMYRSLLTAQPLASGLNLQPQVWLDLHEKGGLWQRRNGFTSGFNGMTRSAIQSEFPDYSLPDSITESGWYDAELGMEPEAHSLSRAIKVAKSLRERRRRDEVIALISHAGFLDILLKAIFDQLPSGLRAMSYYHNNTAITRVNYRGARPILHYMNRVEHLPPDLRSF